MWYFWPRTGCMSYAERSATCLCIPIHDCNRSQFCTNRERNTSNSVCSATFWAVRVWTTSQDSADHKPLESIFHKSLLSAPKHLQRMLLRLQKFDLQVSYKKGIEIFLADTLQLYSNCLQQKIHWDWPGVSEAVRGSPGYIINGGLLFHFHHNHIHINIGKFSLKDIE